MPVDETRLYQIIGTRLKQRRSELGITQAHLAAAAGVLRTSVTNIESGRQKPPLSLLYKLCEALDAEVAAIVPTNAEAAQLTTVPMTIEGIVKEVPPKTAEFLRRALEE